MCLLSAAQSSRFEIHPEATALPDAAAAPRQITSAAAPPSARRNSPRSNPDPAAVPRRRNVAVCAVN